MCRAGQAVRRELARGIAEWVKHRKGALGEALGLAQPQAPHATTYSRILGYAIDAEEFQRVVRDFFTQWSAAGQSVVITLDGKTVRGTIPAGATRGLHQLAVYLPEEGWVLMQVVVEGKENEITAAPRVLNCQDLGKVVRGDALLAQRDLSAQIVEAGGDPDADQQSGDWAVVEARRQERAGSAQTLCGAFG